MRIMMRTSVIAACFAAALSPLALGGAKHAQDGNGVIAERQTDQAGDFRAPVFHQATIGRTAAVEDRAGKQIGTFQEYIFDKRTGELREIVVLTTGEEARASVVPYDRFSWKQKERKLVLLASEEDLAGFPAFDANAYRPEAQGEKKEGATEDSKPKSRMKKDAFLSSDVMTFEVAGEDGRFGRVSGLVIEPVDGLVAFVQVADNSGAPDPLVLPWSAVTYRKATEEQGPALALAMPLAELRSAPTLEGGEAKALEDEEFLTEVFRFFGLAMPAQWVRPEPGQ